VLLFRNPLPKGAESHHAKALAGTKSRILEWSKSRGKNPALAYKETRDQMDKDLPSNNAIASFPHESVCDFGFSNRFQGGSPEKSLFHATGWYY
jgi:hypothetical protein